MARREARRICPGHTFPGSIHRLPGTHSRCNLCRERDSPPLAGWHRGRSIPHIGGLPACPPSMAAARHHRQRQDGGLSALDGAPSGLTAGCSGALDGAGNWTDACLADAAAAPLSRRAHCRPAQRDDRCRAGQPLAGGGQRPGTHHPGHAPGRSGPAPSPGRHHRRRGTRPFLQAAGGSALLGTRHGRRPGASGPDPGAARLGHALAGELAQRAAGPLSAAAPAPSRPQPGGPAQGEDRGLARCQDPGRPGRGKPTGHPRDPGPRRAGAAFPESAGLRPGTRV